MKSSSPALTHGALVATAGRKTRKVHHKLQQAEAQLHTTNEILAHAKAMPTPDKQRIDAAVEQNVAAEEKVHDAAEELQVVKELLSDAETGTRADADADAETMPRSTGQTGDGVRSLIPHLERARSRAAE
jgi:D-ribose pyranose/furanose isomerase RbsD